MKVESRQTVNLLHWKRCRFDSCLSHGSQRNIVKRQNDDFEDGLRYVVQ